MLSLIGATTVNSSGQTSRRTTVTGTPVSEDLGVSTESVVRSLVGNRCE